MYKYNIKTVYCLRSGMSGIFCDTVPRSDVALDIFLKLHMLHRLTHNNVRAHKKAKQTINWYGTSKNNCL